MCVCVCVYVCVRVCDFFACFSDIFFMQRQTNTGQSADAGIFGNLTNSRLINEDYLQVGLLKVDGTIRSAR